jgi:hypothetical protein
MLFNISGKNWQVKIPKIFLIIFKKMNFKEKREEKSINWRPKLRD